MKAANPKAKRRRGGRVLFVVSAMLIASGLIRLGDGTGRAIAREVEALGENAAEEKPVVCESIAGAEILLVALAEREKRIDQQEKEIGDRLQALEVAKSVIDRNMKALVEAENALSATLALADSASEGDLARLTTVYENMKVKDAALLFEEMAPEFSAGFLGRMRPDAAAAIMAGMSPQNAYTVSLVLAGRNSRVPTE